MAPPKPFDGYRSTRGPRDSSTFHKETVLVRQKYSFLLEMEGEAHLHKRIKKFKHAQSHGHTCQNTPSGPYIASQLRRVQRFLSLAHGTTTSSQQTWKPRKKDRSRGARGEGRAVASTMSKGVLMMLLAETVILLWLSLVLPPPLIFPLRPCGDDATAPAVHTLLRPSHSVTSNVWRPDT
jgi:hypothetical protein